MATAKTATISNKGIEREMCFSEIKLKNRGGEYKHSQPQSSYWAGY